MSRMEQEDISSQQLQDLPEALSRPHFDEEATLQSARPVVPLHEVRAVTRSKRHLIFGLSMVAAILLGGIGASLLFTPNDNPTTNVTQHNSVGPSSPSPQESGGVAVNGAHSTVDQPVDSVDSTSVGTDESDRHPAEVSSSKKPNVNKVQARTSSPAPATRVSSRQDPISSARESEAENLEIEERMLRREERREARRLRRERRNSREPSGDDLMRIREIFEGTPRP